MKALCVNFCRNSSLHGLQYLVKGKTVTERVLWFSLLTVMTVLLFYSVYPMWCSLFEGPALVTVENTRSDLSLIDFPAVSVCPNVKVIRHKLQQLGKVYVKNKEEELAFENSILSLSLLKFPNYNTAYDYSNTLKNNVYPIKKGDIVDIMGHVGADLDEIMNHCKWRSIRYECRFLFRQIMTVQGFCYSFNSDVDDKIEDYTEIRNNSFVSLRSNMFGRNSGLGFRLKSLSKQALKRHVQQDSYSCTVHNPATVPDFTQSTIVIPNRPDRLIQLKVSVSTIDSDQSLKLMRAKERGCSFSNHNGDRKMCLLKCLHSYTLKQCHCLPYFLKTQNICNLDKLKCLANISSHLRNIRYVDSPNFNDWDTIPQINCPCFQSCSYITYTSDATVLPLNPTRKNQTKDWTRVRIVYKSYGINYLRSARYSLRGFIVGGGSLASLIFGFSVITLFDFIVQFVKLLYHLTRSQTNVYNSKNNRKNNMRLKLVDIKQNLILVQPYNEHNLNSRKVVKSVNISGGYMNGPIYPFLN